MEDTEGQVLQVRHCDDFESAGRAVLEFLQKRLGFGLWMVTRTEGDDWIVLQTEDSEYGVEPGTVFRWTDSFCSQMVQGKGPRIAPSSELVPAYAAAPIAQQVPIKAYVGLPLERGDGKLFGTLCAIDKSVQPESITEEQELIELLGGLLSGILQAELKTVESNRRAERLKAEAMTDSQTGLYNRRAWDQLMALEEDRCRRYGHPAAILVVDLDDLKRLNDTDGHDAGDELLVRAARTLRETARSIDVVARLGGDEFGILSVECDRAGGKALAHRLGRALDEAGVRASIGLAQRDPRQGLETAWKLADERMFEAKRAGKAEA